MSECRLREWKKASCVAGADLDVAGGWLARRVSARPHPTPEESPAPQAGGRRRGRGPEPDATHCRAWLGVLRTPWRADCGGAIITFGDTDGRGGGGSDRVIRHCLLWVALPAAGVHAASPPSTIRGEDYSRLRNRASTREPFIITRFFGRVAHPFDDTGRRVASLLDSPADTICENGGQVLINNAAKDIVLSELHAAGAAVVTDAVHRTVEAAVANENAAKRVAGMVPRGVHSVKRVGRVP